MTDTTEATSAGLPQMPQGTQASADPDAPPSETVPGVDAGSPDADVSGDHHADPAGGGAGAAGSEEPGGDDVPGAEPPPPAEPPDPAGTDPAVDALFAGRGADPSLAAKMNTIDEEYDDQGRPREAPRVGSEQLAVRDRAAGRSVAAAAAATDLPRLDPKKVEARVDAEPDAYVAASLSHAFGLLGPDDPPQVDLDRQLFAELADLGLDLDAFKSDLAALAKGDQRAFRLASFQTALRTTFEQQRLLLSETVSKLKHSLDTTDRVRLNLLRQAQAVFLLFDAVEQRLKDDINRLGGQATALDASYSALVRKFERLDLLVYDVEERSGAMKEEVRRAGVEIRGSGPAVQRLALIGSAAGALAGGFVAFLLLMSLWLVFA